MLFCVCTNWLAFPSLNICPFNFVATTVPFLLWRYAGMSFISKDVWRIQALWTNLIHTSQANIQTRPYLNPSFHASWMLQCSSLKRSNCVQKSIFSEKDTFRSVYFESRFIYKDVVQALAASRLDYCNTFYVGLPFMFVWQLPLMQNVVVQLLPVTLLLYELH